MAAQEVRVCEKMPLELKSALVNLLNLARWRGIALESGGRRVRVDLGDAEAVIFDVSALRVMTKRGYVEVYPGFKDCPIEAYGEGQHVCCDAIERRVRLNEGDTDIIVLTAEDVVKEVKDALRRLARRLLRVAGE